MGLDSSNKKCCVFLIISFFVIIFLLGFTHYKIGLTHEKMEEIEYLDSLNTYHKIYYEGEISDLKKTNKELYDSLKKSKDRIDFLVQFTANQEYHTGKVIIKKEIVRDTIYADSIKNAKTFEYTNVNPNDTLLYKLKLNSTEEPNWYSLDIRTSTKFTIINKEYENGMNHITIGDSGHNADITDVTVVKKGKRNFWKRFSLGPSITYGYDLTNKTFGTVVGASLTFDLLKK